MVALDLWLPSFAARHKRVPPQRLQWRCTAAAAAAAGVGRLRPPLLCRTFRKSEHSCECTQVWGIFPPEWHLPQLVCLAFCTITKSHIAEILDAKVRSYPRSFFPLRCKATHAAPLGAVPFCKRWLCGLHGPTPSCSIAASGTSSQPRWNCPHFPHTGCGAAQSGGSAAASRQCHQRLRERARRPLWRLLPC